MSAGCPVGRDFATSGACAFKAETPGAIRIGDGLRLLADWRTNRVDMTGSVLLQTFGEDLAEYGLADRALDASRLPESLDFSIPVDFDALWSRLKRGMVVPREFLGAALSNR